MMSEIDSSILTSANENLAPIVQAQATLAELYRLRRAVLKEDVTAMSFHRRRQRDEALKRFDEAEAALLGVLPTA